jgi:hypothetical protein
LSEKEDSLNNIHNANLIFADFYDRLLTKAGTSKGRKGRKKIGTAQ